MICCNGCDDKRLGLFFVLKISEVSIDYAWCGKIECLNKILPEIRGNLESLSKSVQISLMKDSKVDTNGKN